MPAQLRAAATGWRVPAVAVLVALVVGGLGVLRVWPPFAVVMSGSMAPTINTGDMVVLERLRAPARIGQIVAVDVPDAARARYGYPPVVIHRVFTITPDGQIRTKGDARPQPDPFTVPRSAVDTRVIAHIPSGGRVLAFFHSAPGLLWLAFGGLLFFGLPMLERQRDTRRRDAAEATSDLRDELAAVTGELAGLHAEQERTRAATDATLSQLHRLTELIELSCGTASSPTPAVTAPVDIVAATASAPAEADEQTELAAPPVVELVDACPGTPRFALVAASAVAVAAEEPAPDDLVAPSDAVAVADPAVDVDVDPSPDPNPAVDTGSPLPSGPDLIPAALSATAPVLHGAVLILTVAGVRTAPGPVGRWDEPPSSAASSATGWAAAPAPTRRFSRAGRLVPASHG